jgi:hypothetical protein
MLVRQVAHGQLPVSNPQLLPLSSLHSAAVQQKSTFVLTFSQYALQLPPSQWTLPAVHAPSPMHVIPASALDVETPLSHAFVPRHWTLHACEAWQVTPRPQFGVPTVGGPPSQPTEHRVEWHATTPPLQLARPLQSIPHAPASHMTPLPPPQAASPVQRRPQEDPPQWSGPSHDDVPPHPTAHVPGPLQSTPRSQALSPRQFTTHEAPPQTTD